MSSAIPLVCLAWWSAALQRAYLSVSALASGIPDLMVAGAEDRTPPRHVARPRQRDPAGARRRLDSQRLNVLTQVLRVILMIGVRALLDSKLGREAARERDRQRILAKLARSVSTALAPARSLRILSAITVVVGQVAQTPSRAFFAGFQSASAAARAHRKIQLRIVILPGVAPLARQSQLGRFRRTSTAGLSSRSPR